MTPDAEGTMDKYQLNFPTDGIEFEYKSMPELIEENKRLRDSLEIIEQSFELSTTMAKTNKLIVQKVRELVKEIGDMNDADFIPVLHKLKELLKEKP